MNTPKKLKVLGRNVKVRFKPREELIEGAVGLYHFDQHLIEVAKDQSPADRLDTLLHELFHAILHYSGVTYDEKKEERYVTTLATGLTLVLNENPSLIGFITQSLLEHKEQHGD